MQLGNFANFSLNILIKKDYYIKKEVASLAGGWEMEEKFIYLLFIYFASPGSYVYKKH